MTNRIFHLTCLIWVGVDLDSLIAKVSSDFVTMRVERTSENHVLSIFKFSYKLLKLTVPRNIMNRKLKENKQCKV